MKLSNLINEEGLRSPLPRILKRDNECVNCKKGID
jgi:hypothetical protein